ncbi:MAG: PilN domain-containing protein [Caldimonas sp.]
MTQNINLYDPALRERRDWLAVDHAAALVGVAALAVVLAAGWARGSLARAAPVATQLDADVNAERAAMQQLAARSTTRRPDATLEGEVARAERALARRRGTLEHVQASGLGRDGGFAAELEALARQSTQGLWLTGVALRDGDVQLRGRALDAALIPRYVQRLEAEPALQGRGFKALAIDRPLETGAQPAADAASAPGAAVARAEFVEFALTGIGSAGDAPAGEKRP